MFCPIDVELFPEDCRVTHLSSCDQWIYWIQKNGSGSLRMEEIKKHGIAYRNEEIYQLPLIDIYVRNPQSRYVSGLHTYLQFLQRDHPNIDTDTALWFAKRYKFLNRHFLPQFFWLLNLSRYLSPDAKLRIHDVNDLKLVTSYRERPDVTILPKYFAEKALENDTDMDFWFFIDQIILDLKGQTISWNGLLQHMKNNHPNTWSIMIGNLPNLMKNVLS